MEEKTRWRRSAFVLAKCCDSDNLCFGDGSDSWCCEGEFYCSNNSELYAKKRGGILCPIDYSRFGAKVTNISGLSVVIALVVAVLIMAVIRSRTKKNHGHFDVRK